MNNEISGRHCAEMLVLDLRGRKPAARSASHTSAMKPHSQHSQA
jgi:hypothetical protein